MTIIRRNYNKTRNTQRQAKQTHPKQSTANRLAGNDKSLTGVVVGRQVVDVLGAGAWDNVDPMAPHLLVSAARRDGGEGALA